jgi:D-serine deaminase-like pyridoxal phosphate-dependent protein
MLKATSAYLKSLGLTGPAVIVDETRARANIRAMAAKARRSEVAFRPHFKTHQSAAVGRWFADEGVDRITVSSVRMAEQFAEAGWRDITIAFLVNPLEVLRIRDLARYLTRHGGRLGLTVDAVAAAKAVAGLKVDVWVKVDTGYGRTGIRWDATEELQDVLADIEKPSGLLTHAGHSYAVRGGRGLNELYSKTVTRLTSARQVSGRADLKLSVGDTPCCSTVEKFDGIDEIRPGNFVFYDLMQLQIGSCTEIQLGAAAVCPVVGLYPERNQVVVHGGAVHLSKENLVREDKRRIFGQLGTLHLPPRGQPAELGKVLHEAPVISLSQEHGVIEATPEICAELQIGDLVVVWPVHSCLMCDLQRDFTLLPQLNDTAP